MSLDSLNLLLNAPSKQAVEILCNLVFLTRHEPVDSINEDSQLQEDITYHPENSPLKKMRDVMAFDSSISNQSVLQLRNALLKCIETPLISGHLEDLAALFDSEGSQVNPKLKQLIGQIVSNRLDIWRDVCHMNRISLPKLQEFDWSLNFQRSSNEIADIQVPSILMSLTVENTTENTNVLPSTQTVQFELSREALETMIDGLGKIRDQLKNMK